MEPDRLAALARASRKRTLPEGAELIGDAERVETCSNVLSGVVKLTKSLSDGRQQIVGLQFAPDFLGRPFKTESDISVTAATAVSLCTFPRTTIERLIQDSAGLEHSLHQQALRQLDEARLWMLTLGRKNAAEKVASLLLLIARNCDPAPDADGPVAFDLPLTRADIADFLGLTIETVSRHLTRLRTERIIRIHNNRHVTVDDLARLQGRSGN